MVLGRVRDFGSVGQWTAALAFILFVSGAARGGQPGDVNSDGRFDSTDLEAFVDHVVQRATAPGDADCNEDSVIDMEDFAEIIRLIHAPPLSVRDFVVLKPGSAWKLTDARTKQVVTRKVLADKVDVGGTLAVLVRTECADAANPLNGAEDFLRFADDGRLLWYGMRTTGDDAQDIVLTKPIVFGAARVTLGEAIKDVGAATVNVSVFGVATPMPATVTSKVTYTKSGDHLSVAYDIRLQAGGRAIPGRTGTLLLSKGGGVAGWRPVVDDKPAGEFSTP